MDSPEQREMARQVGAALRAARKRHGIYTQVTASEAVGRSSEYVSRAENGTFNMSVWALLQLAHLYDVTPSALLEGIQLPE